MKRISGTHRIHGYTFKAKALLSRAKNTKVFTCFRNDIWSEIDYDPTCRFPTDRNVEINLVGLSLVAGPRSRASNIRRSGNIGGDMVRIGWLVLRCDTAGETPAHVDLGNR